MAQSLSKIYLHIIFHIKTTSPCLLDEDIKRVHAYIGQLINDFNCSNIWIDGVCDHVHVLCLLGRDVSPAHLIEEIKRNSSRWLKTLSPRYTRFSWQGGYAVFSVSQSIVDKTLEYIKNQKEHHKRTTFQEEYRQFLKLYCVDFDERYVFAD